MEAHTDMQTSYYFVGRYLFQIQISFTLLSLTGNCVNVKFFLNLLSLFSFCYVLVKLFFFEDVDHLTNSDSFLGLFSTA